MYELIQVGENTYYINCPTKIGIYRISDTKVCLIDSGNDKDAGKKVLRILEAGGWSLAGIYLTHSHADHMGGSRFLQEKTGCPVYAPAPEMPFVHYTWLEPTLLYGGYPCRQLNNKFLRANPCTVKELTEEVLPEGLTMLPLPGHSFGMAAFHTSDEVWFLADVLTGEDVLRKYQITYVYDVETHLDSLDKVKLLSGRLFIPSHGEPAEEVGPLVQANKEKMDEIVKLLKDICQEPQGFEEILKKVFDQWGLVMDFNQYVLAGSTVRSYLSHLHNQGELETEFSDNRLLWHTAEEWLEWLNRR